MKRIEICFYNQDVFYITRYRGIEIETQMCLIVFGVGRPHSDHFQSFIIWN